MAASVAEVDGKNLGLLWECLSQLRCGQGSLLDQIRESTLRTVEIGQVSINGPLCVVLGGHWLCWVMEFWCSPLGVPVLANLV